MPLFRLPLSSGPRSSLSRKYSTNQSSRKRKRKRRSSDSSSDGHSPPSSENHDKLLAASTNPLSLTPDEIAQYRLAGLSLDEELPYQKGQFDWPHKGLPQSKEFFTQPPITPSSDGKKKGVAAGDRVEDQGQDGGSRRDSEPIKAIQSAHGHRLRMQHLSALTAIVHRCLLEEDIQRATRAYSLLLRAEVSGKALDLKSTGYWGIGAELLVRSFQERKSRKFYFIPSPDAESEAEIEEVERHLEILQGGEYRQTTKARWGSKDGLDRAKSYYETLIIQYPYKKHLHEYVSSLDFWPAMASCEIYGIQSEYHEELQKLSRKPRASSSALSSESDSDQSDVFADAQEQFDPSVQNGSSMSSLRRRNQQHARADKLWTEKDNVRATALFASESLSSRMEETANYPPFDNDIAMLRLRGMLELYIGDLSVPQMPDDLDQEDDDQERRLLYHQRKSEHVRGKDKKQKHWEKARVLFDKCENEGGDALARNISPGSEVAGDDDLGQAQEQEDEFYYENKYD